MYNAEIRAAGGSVTVIISCLGTFQSCFAGSKNVLSQAGCILLQDKENAECMEHVAQAYDTHF